MIILLTVSLIISIVSFISYGLGCFISASLTNEFQRYGLARYQKIVGGIEILGALGLIAGFYQSIYWAPSAGLLCISMLGAMAVRFKMRDSFFATLPAFILFILNFFILICTL